MSKGINKVIIIGNIGQPPELKAMPNGSAVVTLSIATSERWKDKNSGEQQERTEWHRVVAFNRLAEICGQYLQKGSKVYIEGSLRTRKWQDSTGQDRWTTEIVAKEMQMLDGKRDDSQQNRLNDNGSQPAYSAPQQQQAAPQHQNHPAPDHQSPPDYDDDIPF